MDEQFNPGDRVVAQSRWVGRVIQTGGGKDGDLTEVRMPNGDALWFNTLDLRPV